MGALLAFRPALESLVCGECGIEFAVAEKWLAERRNDHKTWYCPNGHPRVFRGESEAERLSRELERERANTARVEAWLALARKREDSVTRARDMFRGKLNAMKERVGNGTCPCCRRNFANLRRHMASKHPTFKGHEEKP